MCNSLRIRPFPCRGIRSKVPNRAEYVLRRDIVKREYPDVVGLELPDGIAVDFIPRYKIARIVLSDFVVGVPVKVSLVVFFGESELVVVSFI
jgi:hypothetical protein